MALTQNQVSNPGDLVVLGILTRQQNLWAKTISQRWRNGQSDLRGWR
jgi:hypothetical protein